MATEQQSTPSRSRSMLLVVCVSIGAALLITGAYEFSYERIVENERARLIENLSSVVDSFPGTELVAEEIDPGRLPADEHVLQIFAMLEDSALNGWVYSAVAPAGYNGPIEFLIGVARNGSVVRIRVMQHRETPGLGDAIESEKSDWARQFDYRSLTNPENWALALDGGSFDALTGATVTPRAVVAAVHAVLQYHAAHADALQILLDELQDAR